MFDLLTERCCQHPVGVFQQELIKNRLPVSSTTAPAPGVGHPLHQRSLVGEQGREIQGCHGWDQALGNGRWNAPPADVKWFLCVSVIIVLESPVLACWRVPACEGAQKSGCRPGFVDKVSDARVVGAGWLRC
jgi:hypothetical protein